MKMNHNGKIYMVCPAYYKTGGTELAHQFVYEANKLNLNAIVAYIPDSNYPDSLNPAFKKYITNYILLDEIEDSEENTIIVPETHIDKLEKYKKVQKCIWWMSVDNYLKNNDIKWHYKYFGLIRTFKWLIKREKRVDINQIDKVNVLNFYQSEYAYGFLKENGFLRCYSLSDYINDDYMSVNIDTKSRKDIVLYNPKKGLKFTNKIIKMNPNIEWIPLINLSNEKIKEYLTMAKVYIDFGDHPGKDRFPREAAMCGCCIITGKNGAAENNIDIPIGSEYKFDKKTQNLKEISNKINECIENYEQEVDNFEKYREKIKQEHQNFVKDIILIRDLINEE